MYYLNGIHTPHIPTFNEIYRVTQKKKHEKRQRSNLNRQWTQDNEYEH